MRIESIGMNVQNFTIDANTSIADNNESFSEIIDELSDEMSKTDTDVEHTKPMDYFLSEAEISLGLKKADMFPVQIEEATEMIQIMKKHLPSIVPSVGKNHNICQY